MRAQLLQRSVQPGSERRCHRRHDTARARLKECVLTCLPGRLAQIFVVASASSGSPPPRPVCTFDLIHPSGPPSFSASSSLRMSVKPSSLAGRQSLSSTSSSGPVAPVDPGLKHSSESGFPHLADVRWRIDVTISTTSLARVFKPSIPMQLTLSDGTISNFECSVEKFHELRYSVAKALKNAQDLQQHPILNREL